MGGMAKGRKLACPSGFQFRPTTGRVKEFIFSYLNKEIEDSNILDLFSGTGSLGIEALSRGAREVSFVEKSSVSLKLLKKNINNCGYSDKSKILREDVFFALKRMGRMKLTFDFILADPPFKQNLRNKIVTHVEKSRILGQESLLILEHESHDPDHEDHGLVMIKQRQFGHCIISVYRTGD